MAVHLAPRILGSAHNLGRAEVGAITLDARGPETILMVEDEPAILRLTTRGALR